MSTNRDPYGGYSSTGQENDDDFISDQQAVPRPARFADGRPTGEATVLAQADGRLGYDVTDAPEGLDATVDMFKNAPNHRDLPGSGGR